MKGENYEDVAKEIVEQMKIIIGPVAVTQANLVKGLSVNKKVAIAGNGLEIIRQLVKRYKSIMGAVALTIARNAVKPLLRKNPKLVIPEELR